MDNPNPIYYRDLITPDDSINNLISQLELLINKYETAKSKIQGAAAQTAESIRNVSGATEEQRKTIQLATQESEKLLKEYQDTQKTMDDLKAKYGDGTQAVREFAKIQKLVDTINREAEGSYNRLSAQYRLNKIRLNEMSAAERSSTEAGRALEAETKAIYEQMNNLQKSTGKAQLQVGQYERALAQSLGVSNRWLNLLTDTDSALGVFKGALNLLKTPLGAIIGLIGAGTAAFKLFKESVRSTQTAGDALDYNVAGWTATWEIFKKSVASVDFSGFITNAARAASAGRDLQVVLDEMFERTSSTRLLRASMSVENAALEEAARNTKLSYKERKKAADEYLKNMQPIYAQEEESAKRLRDAQLNYLFTVTNRREFASEEERKAAAEEFAANIKNYNLNEDLIKQANAYNKAIDDRDMLMKQSNRTMASSTFGGTQIIANNKQIIESQEAIIANASDEVKAYADFARQYSLTNDKEVQAYVDAEEKYQQARAAIYNDQKRFVNLKNNLEAQETQQLQSEQNKRTADAKKAADERVKAAEQEAKDRLAALQMVVTNIDAEIAINVEGTEIMLDLRQQKIEAARQVELEQNRQKSETMRVDEALINAKYDKLAIETTKNYYNEVAALRIKNLQAEQQSLQLQIDITEEGTQERLQLQMEMLDKQMLIELQQNKQKEEQAQQDDIAIIEKYNVKKLRLEADFNTRLAKRDLAAAQDLAENEFNLLDRNERQKTIFRLRQERERLQKLLEMNKTAVEKMTDTEVAAIKAAIDAIDKEIGRTGYSNLYELLGLNLDKDQQNALNTAIDSVKDSLSSLIDSWEKTAEAAVNAADKQVEAAQKVLDAEIEARNAGYANEVATAQKELELAKRNQQKALKEKEKAQKAQLALDSVEQASSLITATANIWKAFSGAGVAGIIAAALATATMWGAFAAAKIKAYQVTQQSEQYGEGTVELLEGGSHASGHDIDLGTKKDGTRRRAEGGEFFAVINKRNSRRYRNVIPDVIKSFNDGSFADRYQRANTAMAGLAVGMVGGTTDVSTLERDVSAIRKQGDRVQYTDGRGNVIIRYKNLTRKIIS